MLRIHASDVAELIGTFFLTDIFLTIEPVVFLIPDAGLTKVFSSTVSEKSKPSNSLIDKYEEGLKLKSFAVRILKRITIYICILSRDIRAFKKFACFPKTFSL